jgi:TRAP-type C4-dicarboxylate transport system substrate-binding protein
MVNRRGVLVGLVLTSAMVGGCAGAPVRADKAGGRAAGPVLLRMVGTPSDLGDVPPVEEFVRRVAMLSDRAIRITVTNQWGNYAPDAEAQVVRAVRSGSFDLGWAGSRVFDSMGVSSFEALSAPMLIDSYPLENTVLDSAMPGQMLDDLKGVGVTGLEILGGGMRLPIAVRRPLLTPADWRGISFGTYRSTVQEQVIRALGATPVEAFGPFRRHDLDTGAIQGFELDVRRYANQRLEGRAPFVAANVALWPEFDVLFAHPGLLSSLTDQQRGWLEQAARDAAKDSVGLVGDDATHVRQACVAGSRFVNATSANLAALRRTLSVVYRAMERDARTKSFIVQIQRLKNATPPGSALDATASCTGGP